MTEFNNASLTRDIILYPPAGDGTTDQYIKDNSSSVRRALDWAESNDVQIFDSMLPFEYEFFCTQSSKLQFQDPEQMLVFLLQFSDVSQP